MEMLVVLTLITIVTLVHGYIEAPPTYDLCRHDNVQVSNSGAGGFIVYNKTSISSSKYINPCVLKIETCAACQVVITPDTSKANQTEFSCSRGRFGYQGVFCNIGCDYVRVFDVYYKESQYQIYNSLPFDQPTFHSESSAVFISFCHSYNRGYNFTLRFNTTRKHKDLRASAVPGHFASPFFPEPYAQNHETYEYVIKAESSQRIMVSFDDWNLDKTSSLYFEDSNRIKPVTGANNRPVVFSDKSEMKIVFHTGVSLAAGKARNNLGFSASYRAITDDENIVTPQTDCLNDGYHFTRPGGVLDISVKYHDNSLTDCLYVVKKLPEYDGMYLRVVKFDLKYDILYYATHGIGSLAIRGGVMSKGRLIKEAALKPGVKKLEPMVQTDGFYLRLNATYNSEMHIMVAYASYKTSTYCSHTADMFGCGTGRCIDKSLKCDGYDHCGDNSDETNCGDAYNPIYDHPSQYELTISVIIPIVVCVFLIMVICLLFVVIRRCRKARQEESGSPDRVRTLSEAVTQNGGQRPGRGGRRRRRDRRAELDLPPSYDEAMEHPPNVFYYSMHPSIPQPPSYDEAMNESQTPAPVEYPHPPGSPSSTDSSQSELTTRSHNQSVSSSSSEGGSPWDTGRTNNEGRRQRRSRHVSSSESEADDTNTRREIVPSSSDAIPTTSTAVTTVIDPDVVNRRSVENVNKPDNHGGKNNKNNGKVGNAILAGNVSQFVIPSGNKPDSEIDRTRSDPIGTAADQADGSEICRASSPNLRNVPHGGMHSATSAVNTINETNERQESSKLLSPQPGTSGMMTDGADTTAERYRHLDSNPQNGGKERMSTFATYDNEQNINTVPYVSPDRNVSRGEHSRTEGRNNTCSVAMDAVANDAGSEVGQLESGSDRGNERFRYKNENTGRLLSPADTARRLVDIDDPDRNLNGNQGDSYHGNEGRNTNRRRPDPARRPRRGHNERDNYRHGDGGSAHGRHPRSRDNQRNGSNSRDRNTQHGERDNKPNPGQDRGNSRSQSYDNNGRNRNRSDGISDQQRVNEDQRANRGRYHRNQRDNDDSNRQHDRDDRRPEHRSRERLHDNQRESENPLNFPPTGCMDQQGGRLDDDGSQDQSAAGQDDGRMHRGSVGKTGAGARQTSLPGSPNRDGARPASLPGSPNSAYITFDRDIHADDDVYV